MPNSSKFQYCPQCRAEGLFFVNQKQIKCRSCGFELYLNTAAAVAALIVNENEQLLFSVRKNKPKAGTLDLPGGFIDFDETAENALRREIREELNLDLAEIKYFASFPNHYLYNDILYHTLDMAFVCKVCSFQNITPADDVADFKFVSLDDIDMKTIGFQSIKMIVRKFIKTKKFKDWL